MTNQEAIKRLYMQLVTLSTTVYARGLIHPEEMLMQETMALIEGIKTSKLLDTPIVEKYEVEDINIVNGYEYQGKVYVENNEGRGPYFTITGDIDVRNENGDIIVTAGTLECSHPSVTSVEMNMEHLNNWLSDHFDYVNYSVPTKEEYD